MKVILEHIDKDKDREILFDDEKQHGLVVIGIGELRFRLSEMDGNLYINFSNPRGHDQLCMLPAAANAVYLRGE